MAGVGLAGKAFVISDEIVGRLFGKAATNHLDKAGYEAALLALPEEDWLETLKERIPAKHREANLRAFQAGRRLSTDFGSPFGLSGMQPVAGGHRDSEAERQA
ncbi:MAG: hypothetical protein HYS64_03240, partial [Rhodospirillales bacterium]|nr:hypothetical protein [Rhodospirillales bacterium]